MQPKRKSAPKRQKKGILRGTTLKVDDAIRTSLAPAFLTRLRRWLSASAHAGINDEEYAGWMRDPRDILYEGSRPKIGDAEEPSRLGTRLDAAMQTPAMILLEPFEGLGA